MKLIMENWRHHLKEQGDSFKCPHGMFVSVMLPPTKREIVILPTNNEGPTAFYRSTGSGTAGRNTEDMWLPMGGVGQHNGDPWIIKLPSSHPQAKGSKFPKEESEFWKIGKELARCYERSPFKSKDWTGYLTKFGLPSYEHVEEYAGIFRITYGAMIVNHWLNSKGALKTDWQSGGIYGSVNHPVSGVEKGSGYTTDLAGLTVRDIHSMVWKNSQEQGTHNI